MTASSSNFPLTVAATATVAIVLLKIFSDYMRKDQRSSERAIERCSQKDILYQVVEMSAPIAAANELAAGGGDATCERLLDGRQLIITADAKVAHYVFNGPNNGNYIRRPAADEGLKELGMLNHGLIWNNDLPVWRKIRGCFRKALGDAALTSAVALATEECQKLLQDCVPDEDIQGKGVPMNLLELSRKVTFRTTLKLFFGLKSNEFEEAGIDEKDFINSIVAYFKAWEFFLFPPRHSWDAASVELHRKSIDALRRHVRLLLRTKPATDSGRVDRAEGKKSNPFHKRILFVDQLRQLCLENGDDPQQLLEQSSLEMLLAGTDTSSVTAYYALLGFAGDCDLQHQLRIELAKSGNKKGPALLDSLINETLRFKPVGPVVLREAVNSDPNFPGRTIKQGGAVLVHLAEMNQRKEYWQDPKTFNPGRFLNATKSSMEKIFFPFGEGPKGCIGMHLGRREVAAIVKTAVTHYDMSIEGAETLSSLETHWDIANQPDKPAQIIVHLANGASATNDPSLLKRGKN